MGPLRAHGAGGGRALPGGRRPAAGDRARRGASPHPLAQRSCSRSVTQRTDTLRPPSRGGRAGGPPGIDGVHRALSVELLDEDQHEVFRRLGILTGAFDLGLVHAVAGPVVDDHLRVVELVGALVDRSLVVAEPTASSTKYRMLQVVREQRPSPT